MPVKPSEETLRAVVTEIAQGYLISVSFLSASGEITIVLDETVDDIDTALHKIGNLALNYNYPKKKIAWVYNVKEGILLTLPKRLKKHPT